MQLAKLSDYALRALVLAAVRHPELVTVAEIARIYRIPEGHVRKIAHLLARQGFLASVRGRAGGYRLAAPPETISLGRVVRATETDFRLVECFDPSSRLCRLEPGCALRAVLNEALEAFLAVLDRTTLADVTAERRRLRELLAL
ncbi:MAG: Rrf2 family transcriptional regulator [Geminicoccaceae bacterium]|nr:Rrf2 family transcriptional regulator [Geminicoccaceae bacterium]MCS7268268.1 Rrf2 family transcriptional regulator [Geminicoccaceae bacterium]MCX7630793.1 Rrf2 family transcriptional regulator [Geminicoccaceae bacterium]MDW8125132.1 Rrf2 family transcriptional regulator [Geminicoccaceae bacterium]MDW8340907.1 Rrf2 family transcriptional regulator [Geminicoccaceae bacterium]